MIKNRIKIIFCFLILFQAGYSQQWFNGAHLNTARAGATALSWNEKIYVFGGKSFNNKILNSVEVYDPKSDSWDSTSVEPFVTARYNATVIEYEDKFYLIGGRTNDDILDNVEVYDPVQNEWTEAQSLRNEREGHSVCFFNDHIYTIGGQKNNFNLIEEIEWFDENDEDWEQAIFSLPYPRAAHFSAVYENTYYMFGGYYYGLTATAYKTVADSDSVFVWKQIPALSEPRAYGVTEIIDDKIYLIGGETASGKTNLVEIYDTKNNIIYPGMEMTMAHSGMASAVLDDMIFVIGGYDDATNDIINHLHIYDPNATTSVDPDIFNQPQNLLLTKAYPNPFNGSTNIEIKISDPDEVEIDIYNSTGQKIKHLFKGTIRNYGIINWDAKNESGYNVSSGIYYALIKSNQIRKLVKLVYVK